MVCVLWADTVEPVIRSPGALSERFEVVAAEAEPDAEWDEEPDADAESDEELPDEELDDVDDELLDELASSAAATPTCGPTRAALHIAAPMPAEATPTRSQLRTPNVSARRARCRPDIINPPDNKLERTIRSRLALRNR